MAVTVNVAGIATIQVDTGSSNALETLGLTENGAEVTFEGYYGDVPCDDNGGNEGPPADVQYFGETAEIRLTLSKFDPTILAKVNALLYGGTAGTPGIVGTLMFAQNFTYRLLINSPTAPLNFPRVIFRRPRELGKGTKYSRMVLVGTAYKNGSGILYNATNT
jgi:hypothetical protein